MSLPYDAGDRILGLLGNETDEITSHQLAQIVHACGTILAERLRDETVETPDMPFSYAADGKLMLSRDDAEKTLPNGGNIIIPGRFRTGALRQHSVRRLGEKLVWNITNHFSAPLAEITTEEEAESCEKSFSKDESWDGVHATRVWLR